MQNTTSTIIAMVLAGVLLFVAPLVTLTDRNDDVTQENVKLIVEEFVTDIRNTGKLTRAKYENFESKLSAVGNNTYDIEMEIKILDENPGKKTSQVEYTKIGENVYYSEFTTQILKQLGIKADNEAVDTSNDTIILKQGDFIYVEVTNENSTAAQTLKSSFIGFSNSDEYSITANSSGMVTVNGIKD